MIIIKNKINKCIICNVYKEEDHFSFIKNRRKFSTRCKQCIYSIRKKSREDNKDKIKKQKHESYLRNKNTYKIYYKNNENIIKTKRKEYNKSNVELIRSYYKNRDPEKLKAKQKRQYLKRKSEPVLLLRLRISSIINKKLKFNNSFKNKMSCTKYLPYTFIELKLHLESLFEPWMTWDNWGKYNPKTWDDNDSNTWKWQIDHIIPVSKFLYKTMNDLAFLQCWSLNNLRPYSAKENILDGVNKIRH